MNKNKLRDDLRKDEGLINHAYQDHLGYWTIGVGRLIDKRKGGGITDDEAYYLLNNDIERIYTQLRLALPWMVKLTEARQRALCNMAFQMGVGDAKTGSGLLGFKNSLASLEAALVTREYDRAADNFLKSKWATQTPERAKRVTDLIRKG